MFVNKTGFVAVIAACAMLLNSQNLTAAIGIGLWTYNSGIGYWKGQVVVSGSSAYIAKSANSGHALTDTTYWAAINWDSSGHAYSTGDFVYSGGIVYLCTGGHVSSATNGPPGGPNWVIPRPFDPPVAGGGQGPAGNDWLDYYGSEIGVINTALPVRNGTTNKDYYASYISIDSSNPHFAVMNNHDHNNIMIDHYCFATDYGSATDPWGNNSFPFAGSVKNDGDSYWNWYYLGYTPAVTYVSACTDKQNCYSWSCNGYKGGTVSQNFVNSADVTHGFNAFRNELTYVANSWGNTNTPITQTSLGATGTPTSWDGTHIWTIQKPPGGGKTIIWKNWTSGIYKWVPTAPPGGGEPTNCAPAGRDTHDTPGLFFGKDFGGSPFGIWHN